VNRPGQLIPRSSSVVRNATMQLGDGSTPAEEDTILPATIDT
jgi:hypothetical protein